MKLSDNNLFNPNFSHIYVEKAAFAHPDTSLVLERFPNARQVVIDNYKQVFNRGGQNWPVQKVRRDTFWYDGSQYAQAFGADHFYYNALVLNCLYDCEYCYLQGMYPSANCVLFVNNGDYLEQTRRLLQKHPVYLALSYDTDLLVFEKILPYCRRWIEFAAGQPDLTIEIRTKSAAYRSIADLEPRQNVVFAWTLLPENIAREYELKAPPLAARLRAVLQALEAGWPVRLCLDPLLLIPDWRQVYGNFLDWLADNLPFDKLHDVSVGVFRMNAGYLKNIRKFRTDSSLLHYPFTNEENLASYPAEEREKLRDFVCSRLEKLIPAEKIHLF